MDVLSAWVQTPLLVNPFFFGKLFLFFFFIASFYLRILFLEVQKTSAEICFNILGLKKSSTTTEWQLRGCLHDIGATFIPARVHSGSLLWVCIRLHDTNTKCHAGARSARFLCRSEIFIPARKFIPVSCKRGMTVRFIAILKFH